MKQKSKIILLLFVITGTLFVSCNLEEEYTSEKNHQEKMKIYHKTFSELLKNSKFNNAYSKVITKKSEASKTVMEEQYQFTITNGIANVAESANETSYTLLIEREIDDPNSFENLIIKNDSLNQTSAFIIKYSYSNPDVVNENFNIGDPTITKEITPIVYNATESTNVNSRYALPTCYHIYYWVCNYPGHTETGVCTHGQEEMISICDWGNSGDGIGDWSGGDGNGSDGGGGGGGTGGDGDNNEDIDLNDGHGGLSTVVVIPEESVVIKDPCIKIQKLQADTNFKSRMANLIDAARGWSFERCYVMYNAPTPNSTNNYTYQSFQGTISSPESGYTGNTDMQGIIHSHYNGLISIFSAGDIQDLYLKLKNYPVITDDFFMGVVTSSNTAYLLQVPDRAAFIAFGDKYLADDEKFDYFMKDIMGVKYNINPNNSNSVIELGFLKMMKDLNMGVSLASVDFNETTPSTATVFNTWAKKVYDKKTNSVLTSNCN